MKNPCNTCIAKVVCTEICPVKVNYKYLLINAMDINRNKISYSKYKNLAFLNDTEIAEISVRKFNTKKQ